LPDIDPTDSPEPVGRPGRGHIRPLAVGGTGLPVVPRESLTRGAIAPCGSGGPGGELVRLRPLTVLVASRDHHFRAVIAMLIARRGCAVVTAARTGGLTGTVHRERVGVAVIDLGDEPRARAHDLATASGLAREIGVVTVAEEAGVGPDGRSVQAKWGSFEQLFSVICRADRGRGAR
jgi:hypothetical protein